MKIFGDLMSGNCLKVKYTADYLGLAYDWVAVDILAKQTHAAEFLNVNPQGQVPVIQLQDGRCLAQSNAIIRYLARGTPLLPEDAFQQAKVDEWLFWEQYSHETYIAVCRFHMVYQKQSKESRPDWRVERGEKALDFMEQQLQTGDWLVGESITVADIALLAYTRVAPEGGFDLSSRQQLSTWIQRCEKTLGL